MVLSNPYFYSLRFFDFFLLPHCHPSLLPLCSMDLCCMYLCWAGERAKGKSCLCSWHQYRSLDNCWQNLSPELRWDFSFCPSFLEAEITTCEKRLSLSVPELPLCSVNSTLGAGCLQNLVKSQPCSLGCCGVCPDPSGFWHWGEERVGITLGLPRLQGEFQPAKSPFKSLGSLRLS